MLPEGIPFAPDSVARFWSRVHKQPGQGCWEWDRPSPNGYGYFRGGGSAGRTFPAHRYAWIVTYGPLARGLEVCHNCPGGDNKACVRPDHMFVAASVVNMRDRLRKRGGKLLTEAQVSEIRRRYAAGERQIAIRESFGISKQLVNNIVRGKNWPHVD